MKWKDQYGRFCLRRNCLIVAKHDARLEYKKFRHGYDNTAKSWSCTMHFGDWYVKYMYRFKNLLA